MWVVWSKCLVRWYGSLRHVPASNWSLGSRPTVKQRAELLVHDVSESRSEPEHRTRHRSTVPSGKLVALNQVTKVP